MDKSAVSTNISPNDGMFKANPGGYFRAGESALNVIRLALEEADKEDIASILDLPSGHGRILRALKAAFPAAELAACDIDREGVDFCAATFGATPIYGHENPDEIDIRERYDLVWCGSLLTHLDAPRWPGFLDLFACVLADDGVVVFTTAGREVERRLRVRSFLYSLTEELADAILAGYDEDGFGYADFPRRPGYGISLSKPAWVRTMLARYPELRLLTCIEQGWNKHQDAFALVRAPRSRA